MKRNDILKAIAIMASTVVITVGLAILLNLYTGPKIAANKAAAESGALVAVMPEGTAFEEITSTLTIDPASGVTAIHKETAGKGYVVMATVDGYSKPVNVTVGVDASGKIVGIELPLQVVCTVVETEPYLKGQTVTTSYKPALLDNGLRTTIPPFVTTGEKIVVATADCSYVERAK